MKNDDEELRKVLVQFKEVGIDIDLNNTNIGSAIYANKPGDGSAREQAASCQRVLGAQANIAKEYATKRYRSNCINWGILPFVCANGETFVKGSWVYIKGIKEALLNDDKVIAYIACDGLIRKEELSLGALTSQEKQILLSGNLINYYKGERE